MYQPPKEGSSIPTTSVKPDNGYIFPTITVPDGMIDNCPAFSPQGYQQWRREVKLRIGAQAGATIAQLLSELIMAIPLSVRIDALTYMGGTEKAPQSRGRNVSSTCWMRGMGRLTLKNRGCGYRSLQGSKGM